MFKQGTTFSFCDERFYEISKVEIKRVNCILFCKIMFCNIHVLGFLAHMHKLVRAFTVHACHVGFAVCPTYLFMKIVLGICSPTVLTG